MARKNKGGFLLAAITGLVMGTAAIVLSDPKKRKNLKAKMDNLISKGKKGVDKVRKDLKKFKVNLI